MNVDRYLGLIAGEFAMCGLASGYYVNPHGLLLTAGRRFRKNSMAYRSWVSSDSRPKIGTQLKQPRPGNSALDTIARRR